MTTEDSSTPSSGGQGRTASSSPRTAASRPSSRSTASISRPASPSPTTVAPTPAPPPPPITVSQQSAIQAAESYLQTKPGRSYQGLISLLDSPYGSHFSAADATFDVNNLLLENDFSQFSTDGGNADFTAALADCQKIQSDVQAAQVSTPIPDATLEQQWSSALADYASVASACISGIQDSDSSLIEQASADVNSGNTAMNTLATDIENAGG